MDRGTRATLITYNTWVRLVVCKRFGHSQSMNITGSCAPFSAARIRVGTVADYDAVRSTGSEATLQTQHGFRLRGVQP